MITIFEGPKYDVASVSLTGTRVFSEAELIPALRLVPGDAYSAAVIKKDTQTMRDYYGSRGYADAEVVPEITEGGDNTLHVTYNVYEGDKFYLRRIDIDGNTKTQDEVIRRELKVAPGDEYNTVLLNRSQEVLNNLGYFSSVEFFPSDSEISGFKDVNIAVAEKSTGTINFGVGFSSIDSAVGFLDITQSNFDLWNSPRFTGGGQKFRASLKLGTERRDVSVSLTEPWFMGKKLALGAEVFYRDIYFLSDLYDQSQGGMALNLRKPLGEYNSIRAEYRLQQIEIDNLSPAASPAIMAEAGSFLQSKISLDFLRDTRDSVYLTRAGHKITAGTNLSGEVLGGDVDSYGFSFGGEQYFALPFDGIFSVEGSLRFVDATSGGSTPPIFDRLFLGGSNNMRGFDYRDVGPKDGSGEPLGGQTSAFFSTEYTFPIFKDKVRGALFYDVGVVNAKEYDFSTNGYNSNWGIGLRLFLPIGPIRLDFGVPMETDTFNDSGGKFNFNLGYQF
jgi:outer membrane protein insertion porin family